MFYKGIATSYNRLNGEALFFKTDLVECTSISDFDTKFRNGEISKYQMVYSPILEADDGMLLPYVEGNWMPIENPYVDLLWHINEYTTESDFNGIPRGFIAMKRF